jgi:hypothetical protein
VGSGFIALRKYSVIFVVWTTLVETSLIWNLRQIEAVAFGSNQD